MQGAVVGTPGTLPTNWSESTSGIVPAVASLGTQKGLASIGILYSGTQVSGNINLFLGTSTEMAATYGQTITFSLEISVCGGSLANVGGTIILQMQEANSGGSFLTFGQGADITSSLSSNPTIFSFTRTLTNAATAYVRPAFQLNPTGAVNLTLCLSAGQMELNSLINSSVASAVVASGGSGGTNGTNVNLTVTGGTCSTQPVIQGTIAGNALTAITAYGTPGSCTVFPPSPATVTGNSLSGATVTLTPTNNAAQGFATSPIPTSGSAVTRAADNVKFTNPPASFGTGLTALLWGTWYAPTSYSGANQFGVEISNGSTSERFGIYRTASAGLADTTITGGTVVADGIISQSSFTKLCFSSTAGTSSTNLLVNGGSASTGSSAGGPTGLNTIAVGQRADASGTFVMDGSIERIAVNPNQALAVPVCQTDTNLNLYNFLLPSDLPDAPDWLKMRFGLLPVNDNTPAEMMRRAG
jgi:hypothetical protein